MFRSFLGLSKKEIDSMSIDEYLKYYIMLKEHLLLLHAPYQKHDE